MLGGVLVDLGLRLLHLGLRDPWFHPDLAGDAGVEQLVKATAGQNLHGDAVSGLMSHGAGVLGASCFDNVQHGLVKGVGHAHKRAHTTEELFAGLDRVGGVTLGRAPCGGPLFGDGVGVGDNLLEQGGTITGSRSRPGEGLFRNIGHGTIQDRRFDGRVVLISRSWRRGTSLSLQHGYSLLRLEGYPRFGQKLVDDRPPREVSSRYTVELSPSQTRRKAQQNDTTRDLTL